MTTPTPQRQNAIQMSRERHESPLDCTANAQDLSQLAESLKDAALASSGMKEGK